MEKHIVGDKVLLKTGVGTVIEAEIIKYEGGYYELQSADCTFPLTLSERTLSKIEFTLALPQVA